MLMRDLLLHLIDCNVCMEGLRLKVLPQSLGPDHNARNIVRSSNKSLLNVLIALSLILFCSDSQPGVLLFCFALLC